MYKTRCALLENNEQDSGGKLHSGVPLSLQSLLFYIRTAHPALFALVPSALTKDENRYGGGVMFFMFEKKQQTNSEN